MTSAFPQLRSHRSTIPWRAALAALVAVLAFAGTAAAQPFGGIFSLSATTPGHIEIPQSPALNPTGAITLEFWVSAGAQPSSACRSFLGKGYMTSYWIGIC